MYGPYSARVAEDGSHHLDYCGNSRLGPQQDMLAQEFGDDILAQRLDAIVHDEAYRHIQCIDSGIFFAAVEYFGTIGAQWCNLPLTTRMISSPGEVYAGKTLDYTTDALPIMLSWFDTGRDVFLSESSQFYLELRLLINGIDKVFSIYNSFRKERADATHLSEFQHIEFEGKVDFEENIHIFIGLLRHVTAYLIEHNKGDLTYFLTNEELTGLAQAFSDTALHRITFAEALAELHGATGESRYLDFSLKHFGGWEEVKLTEILGGHVLVTDYPLMEIPFYHNVANVHTDGKTPLAENADLILYGYREVVGGGTRISNPQALEQKAHQFNLPSEDYAPYLQTRSYPGYVRTSGFGLGWQRYVQWLLKLPTIWDATLIPRGHTMPRL